MEVSSLWTGRTNLLITKKIFLVVRLALSLMCRQIPTRSSMYPSKHPCLGRLSDTSGGSAGSKEVEYGSVTGQGIVFGGGCVACVLFWSQNMLLMMSLAKSVSNSINIHHSAGLNDPSNVNLK